jgi:hypothetical protein
MNKHFSSIAPVAIVLAASLGCAAAHAADQQGHTSTVITAQVQGAQPTQAVAPAEASDDLTRREVYEQLVQAEKDGSLARLNATVYFGS